MAQNKQGFQSIVDHTYFGQFSDHQINNNNLSQKRYGKVDYDSLSEYQNFLYNRALFGVSVYAEDELKNMRWDKRKRIMKVHKRAQTVLNLWKQQIVNHLSTHFFKSIFPNTPFTEKIIETSNETDPDYINRMSFKSLRITKAQVISKLIAEGILPPNFYELKTEPSCK
jgi:hypothetical protein